MGYIRLTTILINALLAIIRGKEAWECLMKMNIAFAVLPAEN